MSTNQDVRIKDLQQTFQDIPDGGYIPVSTPTQDGKLPASVLAKKIDVDGKAYLFATSLNSTNDLDTYYGSNAERVIYYRWVSKSIPINAPSSPGSSVLKVTFIVESNGQPYSRQDVWTANKVHYWRASYGGTWSDWTRKYEGDVTSIYSAEGKEAVNGTAVASAIRNLIADAPADGNQYARKNGEWNKVNDENIKSVSDDYFFVCDEDGNVILKIGKDGFDVLSVSSHFLSLINKGSLKIGVVGGTAFEGNRGLKLENEVQDLTNKIVSNVPVQKVFFPKVEVKNSSRRALHDGTWVKYEDGSFEHWSFNKLNDGGQLYILNENLSSITTKTQDFTESFKDGSTSNLQMKSVDFGFDKLLVGNGKSGYSKNDSYAYIFYDFKQWKNFDETITFENCGNFTKVDFSELGYKCYAFWGDNEDEVFVSVNLFKLVYRVKLGKGSNNLGKGSFSLGIDEDKYNGSFVILGKWVLNGSLDPYAAHGGQFYNGKLYMATNSGSPSIYEVCLNKDGSMFFNEISLELTNGSNEILYHDIDGLSIKGGVLYAQPLNNALMFLTAKIGD